MSSTFSGSYSHGITLNNPGTQRSVIVTGTVANTNGNAIFGTPVFPWTISNSGTIHNIGTTGQAILLLDGGNITNQAAKLIEGYSGIAIDFGPGTVTNLGTVEATGTSQHAIYFSDGGSITNGSATQTSAQIIGQKHAIVVDGGAGTIGNFGTISITGTNANIVLDEGGSVVNGSSTSTLASITGAGTGVYSQSAGGSVTNFGTIQSTTGTGVSLHAGGGVTNGSTSVTSAQIFASGTGIFVAGGAGTVANFGTVQSTGTSSAISFANGGSVSNGAAGSTAARISGQGAGIYITGGLGTVTNFGNISSPSGTGDTAVVLRGGGSVTNFGTITTVNPVNADVYFEVTGTVTNGSSTNHTALLSGAGSGVSMRAGRGTVTNFASITSSTASGVYLHSGGIVTNNAGGRITGAGEAVEVAGGTGTVVNLGTIQSTGPNNCGVALVDGGGVTNGSTGATTALLSGTAAGVYFKNTAATLTNFGTITGAQEGFLGTGNGAHTVFNFGTIRNASGTAGVAVRMGNNGGAGKLLVAEAGGVFIGSVLGGGSAEIDFAGAGTAALGNVSGFKTIKLDDGVAHTATLTNGNLIGVSGFLTVIGGNDGNTINASAVTSNSIIFDGGAGADIITGGSGSDIFQFSASQLTAADKLDGAGGLNQLVMTTAGTIAASGVQGMEIIHLASGAANTLTLTDANFTNTSGPMTIYDGNNGDTVNGAAIATSAHSLLIYAGSGVENLSGGAGNDTFVLSTLPSTDHVSGGAGNNTLVLTKPGAPNVTGVTGIENYVLADGGANTLTLTDANFTGVTGGMINVDDGNGGTTVSGSGLSAAHSITVYAGTGADIITGGAGNDIFYAGGNTTMTGGGGADQLVFTGTGTNKITDFVHSSDKIEFSDAVFNLGVDEGHGTSTPQAIAASLFSTNTNGTFSSTESRFAYNNTTGALFYDAGGSATPAASQLVATLTNHPTLTASDLYFIS
jgi:Ca2+-binding RTX toxin-like protein